LVVLAGAAIITVVVKRSGHARAVASSTQRMAARLQRLAETIDPALNWTMGMEESIARYRRQRALASDPMEQIRLQMQIGYEYLTGGNTDQAIVELRQADDAYRSRGIRPRQVIDLLATSYLRQAVQDNCMARPQPESCLFPIQGSGIHQVQRGSRAAIAELESLLAYDPNDLASRWLLNLAYMTLEEYPDRVPAAWLIPPAIFASDYDIGRFVNIAPKLGVDVLSLAGGSVMDDLDGDGDLDLMASGWGTLEQLRFFRNNGDGTFTERTEEAGLIGEVGGLNLSHADYDNDGDIDVLVLRGAWMRQAGRQPNSLLKNDGRGFFEDATEEAGLLSQYPTQTAAWGDYDNDGWVDLFIGNESEIKRGAIHPCELYHNNGDGTFSNVAAEAGVAHVGFVKGTAFGDYDNDGLLDLYLSKLGEPNALFRNEGRTPDGWRFSNVAEQAGVEAPLNSFPVWFVDYDNDGWLDLFVAPFPGFEVDTLAAIAADYLGLPCSEERPRLYRNQADGTFRDVTVSARLDDAMLAMGANFGDLDNDGHIDFYVGTGEPNLHSVVPNRMYRNAGNGVFQNVTVAGGFGHLQKGHGIAFGDLDNDGDQDIYAVMGGAFQGDVAFNTLFLNPGHGNHWITLRLEGSRSTRSAVGARVTVTIPSASGTRQVCRVIGTGGSFGASSLQAEIGLGPDATSVDIDVFWPVTGLTQRFEKVPCDRIYRIREGSEELVVVTQPRIDLG
jgi:hypothetical protein